jgi:hypothetical protein
MENKSVNIEWLKCPHGVDKRERCGQCISEYNSLIKGSFEHSQEPPTRIPIKRGCNVRDGSGCFCNGSCQDIIGYRDPLYPGEKL